MSGRATDKSSTDAQLDPEVIGETARPEQTKSAQNTKRPRRMRAAVEVSTVPKLHAEAVHASYRILRRPRRDMTAPSLY
jgi:hypothetical protein|nr:hypothetical protein JVH1_9145 [Rhodococcus sp. JVH1]